MKNKHSEGNALDLTAPYDVVSGAAFKVGAIIAVANTTALSGAPVVGEVVGGFTLPKATGAAWAVGDLIYWDDAAKKMTKTTTDNTKAGYAIEAAISGAVLGVVRLVPTI